MFTTRVFCGTWIWTHCQFAYLDYLDPETLLIWWVLRRFSQWYRWMTFQIWRPSFGHSGVSSWHWAVTCTRQHLYCQYQVRFASVSSLCRSQGCHGPIYYSDLVVCSLMLCQLALHWPSHSKASPWIDASHWRESGWTWQKQSTCCPLRGCFWCFSEATSG